ncbi:hypothetical protein ACOMHN_048400 [Nucella lapillus]
MKFSSSPQSEETHSPSKALIAKKPGPSTERPDHEVSILLPLPSSAGSAMASYSSDHAQKSSSGRPDKKRLLRVAVESCKRLTGR